MAIPLVCALNLARSLAPLALMRVVDALRAVGIKTEATDAIVRISVLDAVRARLGQLSTFGIAQLRPARP